MNKKLSNTNKEQTTTTCKKGQEHHREKKMNNRIFYDCILLFFSRIYFNKYIFKIMILNFTKKNFLTIKQYGSI